MQYHHFNTSGCEPRSWLSNILHGYYIHISPDIALLTWDFRIAWLPGKQLYADWVTATSTDNSYDGPDHWGSYRLSVCEPGYKWTWWVISTDLAGCLCYISWYSVGHWERLTVPCCTPFNLYIWLQRYVVLTLMNPNKMLLTLLELHCSMKMIALDGELHGYRPVFVFTNDTPYIALVGTLWSVFSG